MQPSEVLRRLEKVIGIAGGPRRLRGTIEKELIRHFDLPPIQASEEAERLEERIRRLIVRSSVESAESGTCSILSLGRMNERVVVGSCYVGPAEDPGIALAKQRRLHIQPLRDHMEDLTFEEFERFGARVLQELGAKMVRVTPRSGDQGIDFYGLLTLGQQFDLPLPFGKLAHDVTLRFAGQAKHYKTKPIYPHHLRELIGSIGLARYKIFTKEFDLFDDLQLLAFNPLVAMFFTTGRFSRGALELAEEAGVIARSGEQLAVFLADRGVGIHETEGEARFSPEEFHRWLNS